VPIRTPDQRLRVFVSSTLVELATERGAARAAIAGLRLTPILFEAGARPHPPRALYRAYLEQSDIFVGIYAEEYGWVPPDEPISGLEDEFRLAAGMPRLLYLREPAPGRDGRLAAMLEGAEGSDPVVCRRFGDAEELGRCLADDLALLLTERFFGGAAPPVPGTGGGAELRLELPVPPYRLIDREAELARLDQLLADPTVRLVTLSGAGGIGKTRLALAAASAVRAAGGAVGFVGFAAIRHVELVPGALAAGIGLGASDEDAEDRLALALADRPLLLLLDNLEQVVAAAPFLARLLGALPLLRLLVTSREPLRISGEHELTVPPLPVEVEQGVAPAVELLVDRAEALRPGVAAPDTYDVLAQIARRLDGLPLALELAAARMRVLPPQALLGRLSSTLDLLGEGPRDLPERQRTLRATIEWSHALLTPEEQRLFARMAVFRGGAALSDVEQLLGGDGNVLDLVGSLVDKSLVVPLPAGDEPRVMMLETIREYAVERLTASGERASLEDAHARLFLGHLMAAAPALQGSRQAATLAALELDLDNLRAAVDRALAAGDVARLAELGWVGWPFWWLKGHLYEAEGWMRRGLASPAAAELDAVHRAFLQGALAMLLFWEGRQAAALPFADVAVESFAASGERRSEVVARLVRSMARGESDPRWGLLDAEAADRLNAQLGDTWLQGFVENASGWLLERAGEDAPALAALDRAVAAARTVGDRIGITVALDTQGRLYLRQGDLPRAAAALRGSLEVGLAMDVTQRSAYVIQGAAKVLEAAGRDAEATTLAGSADAIRQTSGDVRWLFAREDADWADVLARLRGRLGDASFETAWEAGRAQPAREAAILALGLLGSLAATESTVGSEAS